MRRGAACMLSMLFLAGLLAGLPRHALSEALSKKLPVTVTADKLDYDRTTDIYIAVGHVKIEQEGLRLEADKVVLNNKTGVAEAEGKVYLQDKGDVIHADTLKLNLNTREGVVTKGDLFMKKDNYHLKGDVIERRSETVYHVEHGRFTTCDENDWFIKADEMNIDMANYATASGVSFNVAGVPVAYTPYLLFPVRRQSGLLIPVAGYGSTEGFFAENAFFWAISDYKDMTVYSDYRTRVGHGTGIEYRYMNSSESSGQVYAKYWDMYHTHEPRWEFRFQHQEEFAEDLSARADINLVSDENYYYNLNNLEKKLETRATPYIDSNAFYVERWNTASLYLLGQYSTDLTQPNEKTVQKLPELRYTIYEETLAGPLHLNFEGSATNFTKQEEDGARRVDFNPQLTAAFGSSSLSLTPRAGVRATFYDRSADTVQPTERKYAYAGLDLNARVSRVYGADSDAGLGRIRHSIEPTISYGYIPHVDQGNIPQFDSVDTVSARNAVTVALINRLTAHYKESKSTANYTTLDLVVFRLSQSYDLSVARDQDSTAHPKSDLLGELALRTPKGMFSLSASGSYNTYDHTMSSYTVGPGLTTSIVSLNLTEAYTRGETATRYLIETLGLNLGKWKLNYQLSRDIENEKTTETTYGGTYTSQCWDVRFSYSENYVNTPTERKWTVMLDLKGIGGYGKK